VCSTQLPLGVLNASMSPIRRRDIVCLLDNDKVVRDDFCEDRLLVRPGAYLWVSLCVTACLCVPLSCLLCVCACVCRACGFRSCVVSSKVISLWVCLYKSLLQLLVVLPTPSMRNVSWTRALAVLPCCTCCGVITVSVFPCNYFPCRRWAFRVSRWGSCSASCGLGVRNRTVECVDDAGALRELSCTQREFAC
jgi:hypothetical protein